MKKSVIIIIAVIVIIGAGIAIAVSQLSNNNSNSGGSSETKAQNEDLTAQTEVSMDIKSFAFAKGDITIKKGTKVTWTNQDTVAHNAYGDNSSGPQGKLLNKGESYSFTFDTVGKFDYLCQPHPYMKGLVNVVQ